MYQVSNQKFGEFLSEIRKEKHMTQKELAEHLFVSDKTVSKWECGRSFPNVTLLIPIAQVLDVTVSELLTATRSRINENAVYQTSLQDAISKRKRFWIVHLRFPSVFGFSRCFYALYCIFLWNL